MDDEDQDSVGTLGAIRDQLTEMMDPSTTVEAQSYARKFLEKQLNSPLAATQKEILTQMEKESQAAQETLRAARAKLMARRYNPADRWYSLAKALGAPTRVGGIGELAGRAAGALNESDERRRAFEEKQDTEALGYDEKIAQLGMKLLELKSGIATGQGTIDAELAKESLKTLGKRVSSQQTGVDKAQQALDREYAKEYLDWVQNGSSVANKSIGELGQARDRLRGYSVNEKGERVPITENDFMTRQLGPTGRVIGSLSTIPFVGKAFQDIAAPGSADIRELVEATVQSSLRPILGAQFTEKEGERLISRVYNPRLRPEINAARVERLWKQVQEAAANKNAAAKYYETHGTLKGFQGKYKYTIDDFMPAAPNPLVQDDSVDDHGVPYDGPPNPYAGNDFDNNRPATEGPQETFRGKPVIKLEDLPHRLAKAEGGAVQSPDHPGGTDELMVELPNGRVVPMPAGATYEDVMEQYGGGGGGDAPGGYDRAAAAASLAALGAGTGYLAGRSLSGLGSAVSDLRPGNKETPAQARLLRLMERSKLSPQQLTTFQRRFARLGVPTMPLDFDPNLRAAAETALTQGGADSVELMDRLKARQAESRTRALEQVNKGLKPDDYFDKEQEIKDKLYGNKAKGIESESGPLYKAAEAQFPAISSAQLGKLMDTPSGKKAVKAAMKTMKDKGRPIGKVNPVTGAVMKPSLEFLNQVKIEMDNLVGAAKTAGKDAKARDVGNLRTTFRNELDTATTDPATGDSPYKTARETYDIRKAQLDALQEGREEFGRLQPQEVAKKVAGMNFEQKDAFRTGVAQSIRQLLETPSTDINAAKRLVGSPAMQAKLQALFDTPHEFEVFRTALEKEVETFENSQKLLGRESTVRQRGAEPPKGRIARGAEKAPSLGVFSPTHWALKILRDKPQMKPEEASEIIQLLQSSSPDEIARFERVLGSKYGRKAARKLRGSRMGKVGAAIGALTGALAGGEEEEPPPDEAVLAGLSDEERAKAMQPIVGKAKGGKIDRMRLLLEMFARGYDTMTPNEKRQFSSLHNAEAKSRGISGIDLQHEIDEQYQSAIDESKGATKQAKGGKIETLKALVEDLKAKMPSMDLAQIQDQIRNIAIKTEALPGDVWKMISDKPPPWQQAGRYGAIPTPEVRIPAQPEALAPFARRMDEQRARLEQLKRAVTDSAKIDPVRARSLDTLGMSADMAYGRMMSDPTYQNMQHLDEIIRSLSEQAKRRGGRIRRQFGGGTNHA